VKTIEDETPKKGMEAESKEYVDKVAEASSTDEC
jgi:hypothetical protein